MLVICTIQIGFVHIIYVHTQSAFFEAEIGIKWMFHYSLSIMSQKLLVKLAFIGNPSPGRTGCEAGNAHSEN